MATSPLATVPLSSVKPGMLTLFGVVLTVKASDLASPVVRLDTPDRIILDSPDATIQVVRGLRLDAEHLSSVLSALAGE